jgi:hypothetical protein
MPPRWEFPFQYRRNIWKSFYSMGTYGRSSTVFCQMISLLASENERLASGNWLHFVSFSIRTSLIWEARRKCWTKQSRDLTESEESIFITFLKKLHHFESRSEVFREFQHKGLRLSDEVVLKIEDTNMEFMYYTHYGRPDLIKFKN